MTDKIPPRPPGHDDLCEWWDNVGKEGGAEIYACTCGISDLARQHEHAVAKVAVEALCNLRAGRVGDQLIMNPDAYIDAQLRRIEESGWTP